MYYHKDYNVLYHHGIKGQKWGVRRFQNYDGTRIKSFDNKSEGNTKKGLTDKQKKYLKIGAAVVTTSLVAAGGVYLYKTGKLQAIGNQFIKKEVGAVSEVRNITKVDKDYLTMSDSEKTELVKSINSEDGKFNCQACTAAYDLFRRTGYVFPIRADADTRDYGNKAFMEKVYKDFPGFTKSESSSCTGLANELTSKFGKEDVYGRATIGHHAVSFYSQNGKMRIIESQNKLDLSPEEFDSKFGKVLNWNSVEYARTDNLEISDNGIEFIGRLSQRKKS